MIKKYSELVSAFENFTKTDNLDSFVGLGFDNEIEKARELLPNYESKEITIIREQFLEFGDCLIKDSNDKNDSDEEKLENLEDCELGEELKDFMNEVAKEISKSTTVPTSDS